MNYLATKSREFLFRLIEMNKWQAEPESDMHLRYLVAGRREIAKTANPQQTTNEWAV